MANNLPLYGLLEVKIKISIITFKVIVEEFIQKVQSNVEAFTTMKVSHPLPGQFLDKTLGNKATNH